MLYWNIQIFMSESNKIKENLIVKQECNCDGANHSVEKRWEYKAWLGTVCRIIMVNMFDSKLIKIKVMYF